MFELCQSVNPAARRNRLSDFWITHRAGWWIWRHARLNNLQQKMYILEIKRHWKEKDRIQLVQRNYKIDHNNLFFYDKVILNSEFDSATVFILHFWIYIGMPIPGQIHIWIPLCTGYAALKYHSTQFKAPVIFHTMTCNNDVSQLSSHWLEIIGTRHCMNN